MTDPLDELLGPPDGGETPGLRDALRRRTSNHLVRVKWLRRGAKLAGVAAVFALGVGVGEWRAPVRERVVTVREVETVAVPVPVVVPVGGGGAEPESPAPAQPVLSAGRLELDAEQADGSAAAALYRRAGDAYLTAQQDYANAARCYRLFLSRAGDAALAPESGDSWLLVSIKNATFKEKIYATARND
ncbi:hypothetical protein R5W23_006090 [Gemmata sp. JC673]|uniref:Tetratricopeptide repeat protein n=1 Tax=Gemmata algarum TaxID=2975278 RepID=A0ABU5EZ57_9BACT|nr:hypothetical protein [Gemmata algarum]MDY3558914.1 hypothetical protein [Gemmata algarum]